MRDVKKQAEEGKKKININHDITAGEMQQLFDIYKTEGIVEMLADAFYMGCNVGMKTSK